MSSNNEILKIVSRVVAQNAGYKNGIPLGDATSLTKHLNFDSLDIIDLWIDLDEEFAFNFNEDESVKCDTIGEIVRFIEKEMGEK